MAPTPKIRSAAAAVAALAILATGCSDQSGSQQSASGSGSDQLPASLRNSPAPTIHLADARGGQLDTRSLAGKPYLLTFLYTNCPDVCPLIAEEIHQALGQLGPRADRTAVVAVTVDPEHDTAAKVRAWLSQHREPANFHYLIGSQAQLKPVWKDWYASPQTPGDPQSSHTATIWSISAQGRIAGTISAGTAINPKEISSALTKLLDRKPSS